MTLLRGSQRGAPSASVLIPKVVRTLSVGEQIRVRDILIRQTQAAQQLRALYIELGLDPRRAYRFNDNGEVIQIGRYRRLY